MLQLISQSINHSISSSWLPLRPVKILCVILLRLPVWLWALHSIWAFMYHRQNTAVVKIKHFHACINAQSGIVTLNMTYCSYTESRTTGKYVTSVPVTNSHLHTINNELHQPLMNNYNSPHRHVMKSKTLSRLVDAVYSRSVPVSWPGARIPQDVLFDLCRTLARSSESTLLHTEERIRMNRKELCDAERPGKKCWLLSGAFIPDALYSTEKETPHQKNSHFKVELK